MAQTIGLVQRLKITNPPQLAWAYIGPTPTDTELLLVLLPSGLGPEDAAFRGAMADALSAALANQREVIASHPDDSAEITAVEIRTA
jgi:hypothetical protein